MDTSELYQRVAREAWQQVNAVYRECQEEDDRHKSAQNFLNDSGLYLYVFANGSWTIDHPQYIPTTNGCISAVPLAQYNEPAELAEDIEANEDWDAIEDSEDEDGE